MPMESIKPTLPHISYIGSFDLIKPLGNICNEITLALSTPLWLVDVASVIVTTGSDALVLIRPSDIEDVIRVPHAAPHAVQRRHLVYPHSLVPAGGGKGWRSASWS